jgi:hypothetical protein
LNDVTLANEQLSYIFTLLLIFQIKHFAADFPLQLHYMLKKVSAEWDFFLPLALHCLVHALLSLCILIYFKPSLWYLAVMDFVVHFTMDRIKAGPRYLGRFSDISRSSFWIALGFDQMVHHFTHYYIIYRIVTHVVT